MPVCLDWRDINIREDFHFANKPTGGSTHKGVGFKVFDDKSEREVPLIFRGEKLYLPFGVNGYHSDIDSRFQGGVSFSFPTVRLDPATGDWMGDNTNSDILDFFLFMNDLDQYFLETVTKNYKSWFNKEHTADTLKAFHCPFIKSNASVREGKYSPTLSAKVDYRYKRDADGNTVGGDYITKLFDEEKQLIDWDGNTAFRQQYAIPVFKASRIWFGNNAFGVKIEIVQMMIFSKDEFVGCIIDVDEAAKHEYPREHPPLEAPETEQEEDEPADDDKEGEEQPPKRKTAVKGFVEPRQSKRQRTRG